MASLMQAELPASRSQGCCPSILLSSFFLSRSNCHWLQVLRSLLPPNPRDLKLISVLLRFTSGSVSLILVIHPTPICRSQSARDGGKELLSSSSQLQFKRIRTTTPRSISHSSTTTTQSTHLQPSNGCAPPFTLRAFWPEQWPP